MGPKCLDTYVPALRPTDKLGRNAGNAGRPIVLFTNTINIDSVVTASLFQGRSASIGVSMKKSVVGSSFGVYRCSPSAAVRLL